MPRLLVVVAHPDDETFGTGSIIANAAAAGVDVTVCCATRGEAGVDTSGTTASPEELAQVREGELRSAAQVLGAREVVLLDFADSDMNGPMPEGALSAVDFEAVVAPVAEVIERVQPDVVVTFDPESIDDHRDHQRMGEATTIAFHRAAAPGTRLYHWTLARSVMDKWMVELKAKGLLEAYIDMELGRPDAEITTIVDVAAVADMRRAGIAEHTTQTGPFEGISEELMDEIFAYDYFMRIVPPWDGGPVETSLFG